MFVCEFCERTFKSRNALNAHLGIKHKEKLLDKPVHISSDYSDDYLDISNRELKEKREKHSGICDVCGKVETANTRPDAKSNPNNLCIDHDHNTKRFRGFLCVQCNRNFGWYDKYKDMIKEHEEFKHV